MSQRVIVRVKCPDLRFWREANGEDPSGPMRGVARVEGLGERIVQHSPDGYEWGYGGSGPADTALNIMAACLPVGCDGQSPVKLYRGFCSQIAWDLHHPFKRDFLAGMPPAGEVLYGSMVDAWIDEQIAGIFAKDPNAYPTPEELLLHLEE